MFEGVAPEQFQPFILATTNPSTTTTTTIPPPPSLSPSPHLPLHLSFASPPPPPPSPSPAAAAALFPVSFDPYQVPPPNFFHPLNHTTNSTRSNVKNHHEDRELMPTFGIPHHHHQQKQQKIITEEHQQHWSNEEVLALLRIRSSMELNWFPPEFTWEHVSRKLSEVGFKRSPEKCREKFEEETRFLNSIHTTHNHNYFPNHHENGCINQQQHNKYAHDNDAAAEHQPKPAAAAAAAVAAKQEEKEHQDRPTVESDEDGTQEDNVDPSSAASHGNHNNVGYESEFTVIKDDCTAGPGAKKRKRRQEEEEEEKFEMFKGLCQEIVDKMMAQQEEMQNKLIDDMVKRDREKLAWEEAWKKREMDRINHELQLRADEQALAGDRQASIIKFLENFTTTTTPTNAATPPLEMIDYQMKRVQTATGGENDGNSTIHGNRNSTSSSSSAANPSNNSCADELSQLEPGAVMVVDRNDRSIPPNSSRNPKKSIVAVESKENRGRSSAAKEEVGKRWPRDEVLALINLRCGIHNHNHNQNSNNNTGGNEGEGTAAGAGSNSKAPLWERISRGMAELGYRRSAKRCKEKWENINKYFRKTKDLNKKRSVDSRTCPYFHQLSSLYGAAAAKEEQEDGAKPGTDIAASDSNSAAVGIVAPAAAASAAASFDYEF